MFFNGYTPNYLGANWGVNPFAGQLTQPYGNPYFGSYNVGWNWTTPLNQTGLPTQNVGYGCTPFNTSYNVPFGMNTNYNTQFGLNTNPNAQFGMHTNQNLPLGMNTNVPFGFPSTCR